MAILIIIRVKESLGLRLLDCGRRNKFAISGSKVDNEKIAFYY